PSEEIYGIAIGTDNQKWLGTKEGLAEFDGIAGWSIYDFANSGLPSDYVTRLTVDADNVKWVGTDPGVSRYDGTDWELWTPVESPRPRAKVVALTACGDRNRFLGSGGGALAVFTENASLPGAADPIYPEASVIYPKPADDVVYRPDAVNAKKPVLKHAAWQ